MVRCGAVTAILAFVAHTHKAGVDLAEQPSSPKSAAPMPESLTPLQRRVRAAIERAEEAKRGDAALPDRVRRAEVGVITTIVGPGASWPCATSKTALAELMKWRRAMLDEQEPDSVMNGLADSLTRTRSIMVEPRTQVEILEEGSGIRKVTIVDRKAKYGSGYRAVAAHACWIAAEAVTRGTDKNQLGGTHDD